LALSATLLATRNSSRASKTLYECTKAKLHASLSSHCYPGLLLHVCNYFDFDINIAFDRRARENTKTKWKSKQVPASDKVAKRALPTQWHKNFFPLHIVPLNIYCSLRREKNFCSAVIRIKFANVFAKEASRTQHSEQKMFYNSLHAEKTRLLPLQSCLHERTESHQSERTYPLYALESTRRKVFIAQHRN
jgi:hypothetical protein